MTKFEQIAREIYRNKPGPDGLEFLEPEPWRSCIDAARAVLKLMREPDAKMLEEGWYSAHDEDAAGTWRDMIDAILAEAPPKED